MFWPFTVWINCSSDLKSFANSWPSASNFNSFSRSLKPNKSYSQCIKFVCHWFFLRNHCVNSVSHASLNSSSVSLHYVGYSGLHNSPPFADFSTYRISANSFHENYFFLNSTLSTVTFCHSTYKCGNYSREETIVFVASLISSLESTCSKIMMKH